MELQERLTPAEIRLLISTYDRNIEVLSPNSFGKYPASKLILELCISRRQELIDELREIEMPEQSKSIPSEWYKTKNKSNEKRRF